MAVTHAPGLVTRNQQIVADVCDDMQVIIDRFQPHGALDWPAAESLVSRLQNLLPTGSQPVPYMRAHADYEPAHAVNVAIYSMAVAQVLGFQPRRIKEVGLASLFHDIGKFMPQSHPRMAELLQLPDHGTVGLALLRENIDVLPRIAEWVGDHHERLDGSGPRVQTSVSVEAQIIGLVDIFDANLTPHPRSSFLSPHSARSIALSVAPGRFASEVIAAFDETILPYPPESPVKLSDGTTAMVVTPSDRDNPLMPVIKAGDGNTYDLADYAAPRVVDFVRIHG